MPYTFQVVERLTGVLLGELRPITWNGRWGISKTGSLNMTLPALEPMTPTLRRTGEINIVVRERLSDSNPVRLVAEVVDVRRSRTADGGGGIVLAAFSAEWRWPGIMLGNTISKDPADNYGFALTNPWLFPRGQATGSPVALDRSILAQRLIEATGFIQQQGDTAGYPQQWEAAGLKMGTLIDGTSFVGYATHDPGIRVGSITPCGGTLLLTPEDLWRTPASAVMDKIAGGLDGFEWWMTYDDAPTFGGDGYYDALMRQISEQYGFASGRAAAWARFNCAAAKGVNRPDVAFEYGGGAANVESFEEHLDFTNTATNVTVPPPGAPTSEIDFSVGERAAFAWSYPAAAKYGVRDRIVTTEVSAIESRRQLAQEALQIGARAKQTISFAPAARGANTPWPFIDFEHGDRVRFLAWEPYQQVDLVTGNVSMTAPQLTIDASLRVYAFEISGAEDGTESAAIVVVDDGS